MKQKLNKKSILALIIALLFATGANAGITAPKGNFEIATLAGGCFWCVESDLEKVDGIKEVISGFSGGKMVNPAYKDVSSGSTKHREAVQVYFNPKIISYAQVLDVFWKHMDPTDANGSFNDRGFQYSSAIFVHNDEQRTIAEASKKQLDDSNRYNGKAVVTPVEDFTSFYQAEKYHQDYHNTHTMKYKYYRYRSGRDKFVKKHWGDEAKTIIDK